MTHHLFEAENAQAREKINILYPKVVSIFDEMSAALKTNEDKYHRLFYISSKIVSEAIAREREISPSYFFDYCFEELKQQNLAQHKHKSLSHYETSLCNPAFATSFFSDELARTHCKYMRCISSINLYVYEHLLYRIYPIVQLLVDYYECWKEYGIDNPRLIKILREYDLETLYDFVTVAQKRKLEPAFDFYTHWINTADFSDLRYLFYFGYYVSDDTIRLAKYCLDMPQEKIDRVMRQAAKAFIDSFAEVNRQWKGKKTVVLGHIPLGMERFARSLIMEFQDTYGLKSCIGELYYGSYDQQYRYDSRFHDALYLDKEFLNSAIKQTYKAIEDCKDIMSQCAGSVYFDHFGDKPFIPDNKKEILPYTKEQIHIAKEMQQKYLSHYNQYFKRSENSYCFIAFPLPSIGTHFEEIFEQTADINMLDSNHYLLIQQCLIDVLDRADVVHIRGKAPNKTDLYIKMPPLANPNKETNFYNCGATQNIPVGEVFTSPQLAGTHGVLHLTETYLHTLLYKELLLTFTDGRVSAYSCKNYADEKENRQYIYENLFKRHDSLPIGEFAIGTNTLAYKMAKKYNILSVLPILIAEKMGPHFAVGDTCYAYEEDITIYNPNGKEIVARDNEQSILRKSDDQKAYYHTHTDISLPYDEIEFITAIIPDGTQIDIIRDGRFVVEGTLSLNIPLE